MIDALDDTLAWLLRTRAEAGSLLSETAISFEMPDDEWRRNINRLTLDCYLYDVRENKAQRSNEELVRKGPGLRPLRQPAPPYVDATYCLTAWTPRGDTAAISTGDAIRFEHRLLSQALAVLLRNPRVEGGTLADPDGGSRRLPPHPVRVASVDVERGMSEFWSALGQQPKPSLNFVLTMAVPVLDVVEPGAPVQTIAVHGDLKEPPTLAEPNGEPA